MLTHLPWPWNWTAAIFCLVSLPGRTQGVDAPFLIYNCAKLPAICANVDKYYRGTGQNKIVNGFLDHMQVLTYAGPNSNNRDAACPSRWKTLAANQCPATSPPQPLTVPEGASVTTGGSNGAFQGQPYIKGQTIADSANPLFNVIARPDGSASGMMWTCEEWPPNFSQQGGAGASTYCAPASVGCSGALAQMTPTLSEQDFQKKAHYAISARLRKNAAPNTNGAGLPFTFDTTFDPDADSFATAVVYDSFGDDGIEYQKREEVLAGRRLVNNSVIIREQRYTHNRTVVAQKFYYVYAEKSEREDPRWHRVITR